MSNNNRIYWAVQGVAIAAQDSTTFGSTEVVHGLQQFGMTTTFNLKQVFELGQLSIYENIEDIPDIQVTMEKVLDGYPLIYHLATRGASTGTLAGRSDKKCNVALNIYDDTYEAASGTANTEVFMSGMYVSSLSYSFPVDGEFTESVTLVGNNKEWRSSSLLLSGDLFDGTDGPSAVGNSHVQNRQYFVFGADTYSGKTATLLPTEIEGISSSGTNDLTSDVLGAHIQSITVSADLGRDALNELSRKGPYFRYVNFPVEVSTEISVMSTEGDQVDALEGVTSNISDQTILIVSSDSTKLDLGTSNKLSNISYGGGDAGGGNVTTTYSYTGFNELTVTHDADPG